MNTHRISAVAVFCLVLAACGGDDDASSSDTVPASPATVPETTATPTTVPPTSPPEVADGTVSIRLEPVEGIFIEGFEVGLRVEDAEGNTIASTLWSDMVADLGDDSIEAFYESTWDVAVPSGPIVIHGTANVGAGPPPETPDVAGDLNCSVEADIAQGATVEVEVSFEPRNCLSIVDDG